MAIGVLSLGSLVFPAAATLFVKENGVFDIQFTIISAIIMMCIVTIVGIYAVEHFMGNIKYTGSFK